MRRCEEGIQLIRHGYGNIIWKDGARYDGQWENGKANGNGIFHHINGDVYQGEFKNDKANGYGIYFDRDNSNTVSLFEDATHSMSKEENILIVQKILNSILMDYYVSNTSVSIQGGFPCYQKNFIEKFTIPIFLKNIIYF